MNGYKVFGPDWTCRDMHYEVGKTYEIELAPVVCKHGFHFCQKAVDCFNYHSFDPQNKVAEIIAHGDIAEDGDKYATNKIEIVREIPWSELLEMVNTGKGNTGRRNSGHRNSGDFNTGHRNTGDNHTGDFNSGHHNSGDFNSGDFNSGHHNSGDFNSGHRNSGDFNSGHHNSGDFNSGHHNSGDFNSGHRNSGDFNSGYRNSGDFNSGDCNRTSFASGCFNTEKHDLLFFDKPTSMTFEEWRSSDAFSLLRRADLRPTEWVHEDDMTDEEKVAHPEAATLGGYLKTREQSECFRSWWADLRAEEKDVIKGIPNFDPDKFRLITGIEVV